MNDRSTPTTTIADAPRVAPARPQPPLNLQAEPPLAEQGEYHVNELLRYHDRHFITNTYRALLRRDPDEHELARDLDDLRGGRRGKLELIEDLLAAHTTESSAAPLPPVRVAGLRPAWRRRVERVPIFGALLSWVRALVRLPLMIKHQQQFETYLLGQQQRIAEHVNGALAEVAADVHETATILSAAAEDMQRELQAEQHRHAAATREHAEAWQRARQQHEDAWRQQQEAHAQIRHEQLRQEQQELWQQEQQAIVEAQKAVLADIQERLRQIEAHMPAEQAHAPRPTLSLPPTPSRPDEP